MKNKIISFVNNLEKIKPSSNDVPKSILRNYIIKERHPDKKDLNFNPQKSLLEELMIHYTMEKIDFGDFRFNIELEDINGEITGFATGSHSKLIFFKDKEFQELYEYDRYSLIPLEPVSINQESFLNALSLLMEFYSQKFDEPSMIKKQKIDEYYFPLIVEKAGGDKYSTFFKNIIFW
jgi:hypothetical protein